MSYMPPRPTAGDYGDNEEVRYHQAVWERLWGDDSHFHDDESSPLRFQKQADGKYLPRLDLPPQKTIPIDPFTIYLKNDRIYIKTGYLPYPAIGNVFEPITDFSIYQRPGGTDDDPTYFVTLDPLVTSYDIYLAHSIADADLVSLRPAFVAIPDADPTVAIQFAGDTVFDWSGQFFEGEMRNYVMRLGAVDYTSGRFVVSQIFPIPPLHLVGQFLMHYRGTYDAAKYYTCGAVVSISDSNFDYQFILAVGDDSQANYSPKSGPVIGVAPDTALSYPWAQLSKSPKVAAAYHSGAYDAAKSYLRTD